MDVRLSPEQQALRDSAAVVADRLGPKAVRDLDDAERAAKLDAAVDASGWRELRVAAEGSRPLASAVEAALVAEELSRALADTAFLGPTLAADLRRLAGADPATGVETVALMPDLSAAAEATGGALPDGAVAVDSRQAAAALVLVPSDGGHRLGRIALKEGEGGTDLTRPSIFVPPGTEVAPVEPGGDVLSAEDRQRWTALGLALTSAELVGVMRGMIEVATDYARSRRQYGVPIGSFQAVQHLLADALVAMEGSRSAALHAAWAVDALPPDEAVAAGSVAKAYCSRAARLVGETGIQVHGGIGNTWECLAHVYLRRALLSTDVLGGIGASLARVLAHNGIDGIDGIGGGHGLQ